jgi:hypothetical protein
MKHKTRAAALLSWVVAASFACAGHALAQGQSLKIQAQLVWGTTEKESPNPKHQPVDAEVARKLKQLPLKWDHYFVINKVQVNVPAKGEKKEPLSEKCAIEIKDLGGSEVEISMFGKGKHVVKRTQKLPKGELVVLGGNAPNETAWLVLLKRID